MGNNSKFNYKFMQMANLNMKTLGYKSFIRWCSRSVGLAILIGFSGEALAYKKIKLFFDYKLTILSSQMTREYCYK